MMLKYLQLIGTRVTKRSLLLSDQLSITAGVLTPAITYVAGKNMHDTVLPLVAWGIIGTVAIGAFLRTITAPYFIWREDQMRIADLLDDLAKPSYLQNQRLAEHFAHARANLATAMGEIGTLAECHIPIQKFPTHKELLSSRSQAFNLMYQFFDDTALVSMCREYMQIASIVVDKKDRDEDHREDIREMYTIARLLFPKLRKMDY